MRCLLVVGCRAVAAFAVFVEPDIGDAHFLHPGGHFARLHRPNPVIAGGRVEENRRVSHILFEVVIRRKRLDKDPLIRLVRIAIFRDPGRPGRELRVALHVQQRDFAGNRAKQLWIVRQHVADQQTAIAAPFTSQVGGRRHAAIDQILGDGGEVLIGAMTIRLQRGMVPGRAILAASPDIGDDINAAPFEPGTPNRTAIGGGPCDLEPAVAIQQCWSRAVQRQVARTDLEIRARGFRLST